MTMNDNDLDPAYDRETAVADLTRISAVLATIHDKADVRSGVVNPPSYEDCQGMAADLNQVIAFLSRKPSTQSVIPLSELDATESLHLDKLAAEEGLERTDFTVWRWNGLAITECDGYTHDLTNGLDLDRRG